MLRRRRFWLVFTALVFSTVWWEIDQSNRGGTPRASLASSSVLVVAEPLLPLSPPASVAAPSPRSVDPDTHAELNSPETPPVNDLKIVDSLVINYLAVERPPAPPLLRFNEEITRGLTGTNRDGLVFLPADHPAIDRQGRLCDRWGTPYFFHPLSGTALEILSAGPDRKFFTHDDLQWPESSAARGKNRDRVTSGE